MKIRINKKTWLLSFIIVFLPVALALEMNYQAPFVGYADEIFSLIMLVHLCRLAMYRKLEKSDAAMLLILMVFTMIGMLSNLYSKLMTNLALIALDAFWQWKIFLGYMGAKYLMRYDRRGLTLRGLRPVAKLLILSACVFGVLSFWFDLGMTDSIRYGLPEFRFVFGNQGRYGIIVAVSLLIVLATEPRPKRRKLYILVAIADMIFSTKGVVYVIIPIFLMLWFIFEKIEKTGEIKTWIVVLVVIVGVLVSSFQITTYLLDASAPRALLIRYGFVTANTYFPFGSGFGTYGSEIAAQYYSPLYMEYGWADKWMMGLKNGNALNDNHMATIIGESGYFGLVLFLMLFWIMFRQINQVRMTSQVKAMTMSLFICMMICFLATGIAKSSIGVMVFIALGVMVREYERRAWMAEKQNAPAGDTGAKIKLQ